MKTDREIGTDFVERILLSQKSLNEETNKMMEKIIGDRLTNFIIERDLKEDYEKAFYKILKEKFDNQFATRTELRYTFYNISETTMKKYLRSEKGQTVVIEVLLYRLRNMKESFIRGLFRYGFEVNRKQLSKESLKELRKLGTQLGQKYELKDGEGGIIRIEFIKKEEST